MRAAALLAAAAPAAAHLGLSVEADGSFAVSFDGRAWLSGGEVVALGKSASDKSLVPTGAPAKGSGSDALGAYDAVTLSWAAAGSAAEVMRTSFRTYARDPGAVVFEQSFPAGLDAPPLADPVGDNMDECRVVTEAGVSLTTSASGYDAYTPKSGGGYEQHAGKYCDSGHKWAYTANVNASACAAKCAGLSCTCYDVKASAPSTLAAKTVFPGFARGPGPADSLAFFSYNGVFPKMKAGASLADYKETHQGGAPLVMYDAHNASLPMTVFSPLNYPKAHHMASSDKFFGAGVKATVTTIPAGWSQLFLLSAGVGINDGMMAWGDRMLKFTGKPRADMYLDQTHSTIGFWTDNGGYYHYATGTSENYEVTLPKVKAYHDSIGVPFGHWQFDSWFYPKDGGVNPGGGGGAVVNWTAMDSVFPHGMAYIQSQIGLPTVMHNRQWSTKSDYIKNEPFEWYTSHYAIPKDPIAFFTWFFKQQEGWGLSMYEQDWMCTEYDGVDALQQNVSMGDLWLLGMATGAASSGRTVQYCMPYPNDVLSASAYPAVTNARATGDYFHSSNQWAVGGTSLFYWAIGILPFKDGFYSSTNKQVGGQTVGPEKDPDREALMATLSCAMVGPMDGINLLNASRMMTTCRGDGVVLRPDKPVSTADWCFAHSSDPASCYVYSTHSDVAGVGRVRYHFNNDHAALQPAMVGLGGADASAYAVYNWYSGEVAGLNATVPLAAGYEGHVYATVIPVTSGWAFLGETGKYVTHAARRFGAVSLSDGGVSVPVTGAAGETVRACAARRAGSAFATPVCGSVAFTAAGTQTLSIK